VGALRILVLGGSRFVGRHIVDAFVARGDNVTLFNRGVSDPSPRADALHVKGDRAGDLTGLGEQNWDAVIDTSGYTPNVVKHAARFLESRTERYLFVSSISVYDFERVRSEQMDEDAPLLTLLDGVDPTVRVDEHYGALKSLCEIEVERVFGKRATILRLGLVAGPHDPTDRFSYWVLRVAAGGEVLAPPSERPIQYIDARDAAEFAVAVVHGGIGGTYNVVVPPEMYTFGDLIAACARASGSQARMRWAEEAFLLAHGAQPWSDLPLWIPRANPAAAMLRTTPDRAFARGLLLRPLFDTADDVFAWAAGARNLDSLHAGLSRTRERELLDAHQD